MTIPALFQALPLGAWVHRLIGLAVMLVLSLGIALGVAGREAIAASPPAETATVHLGTQAGELKFVPDRLQFKVGQRYALMLDNPSSDKHYFTAKDFADAIWTQKVEAGNVEIKGAIHDIELRPSTTAEWYFVPQKAGTYALRCSISGHAEAGMRGTITVVE